MSIEDAEDFAIFFDPAAFGFVATYAGGAPVVTRDLGGIFHNPHATAGESDGWPGVSTVTPSYTCRASALPPGARVGDRLTLQGVTYTVRDIQPDGTGLARLILERT